MIFKKLIKKKESNLKLKILNTNKILKNLSKNVKNTKFLNNIKLLKPKTKQTIVNYVINIHTSQTNTLINITNIQGNTIISITAGSIKFRKKQKRTQPLALLNIFKKILLKANFLHNQIIAIHFKNVKIYYESLIIKMVQKLLFIKSIKSYNLSAHNGCRPKKIKRL